jgi:hypothetical protein
LVYRADIDYKSAAAGTRRPLARYDLSEYRAEFEWMIEERRENDGTGTTQTVIRAVGTGGNGPL